jgi:hypothetical protein
MIVSYAVRIDRAIPLFRYSAIRYSAIPLFRYSAIPLFRYSAIAHSAAPRAWMFLPCSFRLCADAGGESRNHASLPVEQINQCRQGRRISKAEVTAQEGLEFEFGN